MIASNGEQRAGDHHGRLAAARGRRAIGALSIFRIGNSALVASDGA